MVCNSMYLNKLQGYMVRFWDDYTEYIMSFTSGGKVKQIELEHWKEAGVKFFR